MEIPDPQDAQADDPTGPTLTGTGPAWPPLPEPLPPAPQWINGRAFPAVWRELLEFGWGGLAATAKEFPHMRPGRPWQHRPDPGSDADIDQAIAAKLHLALHGLPLLAEADVAVIEPPLADLIPDWDDSNTATRYAATAQLPHSPLFMDFEGIDGLPAAWHTETWPLPLHLRGVLCWQAEGMLCVMPFGSVGGVHPWGGLDYHAWARWSFLQEEEREQWPLPGPGDFLARANGEVLPWVELEGESVCAHQGALAWNLSRRALRVLQLLESVGGELVEPRLPRPVRRRAAREGQRIARVPARLPTFVANQPMEAPVAAMREAAPCVVPKTHARLEQAHSLWHEALAAYHDPELFVTKLNALIQALRTVTWVLRQDFGNSDDFKGWYEPWEDVMKADARVKWARDVRNQVEKRGDLEASSVAHVRVIAGGWSAPVAEFEVDPTSDAGEILRGLQLGALPEQVRNDGLVEVERRWTLPELSGEEVLEVLAHCWGVLARIVAAGHHARGQTMDDCVFSAEPACGADPLPIHPSGRWPCMVASRESRTRRRNLATGAPYELEVVTQEGSPQFDEQEMRERYRIDEWDAAPAGADSVARGAAFHRLGRNVLVADSYHLTIAWLLRDGAQVAQTVMQLEDQQGKTMMAHRLAVQADRLGADGLILTTEVWGAPVVEPDDPRFALRPQERDDRREALVTYAVARDGPCHVWVSAFRRNSDGSIVLEEVHHETGESQPFLEPVLAVWRAWSDESSASQ